ncbi:HIT family protein [Gracilibacillus sp. S3-1-1]|uniref:HIT family protein n=1 Tax=Gracilibacillus pellucidus TaxID=3095368 RepID=A0ACC6M492_9BACI|nr:HIT family protein [Gracilibacillus sp. S3-1-1]MDX8045716.1 HIT family protein [Gracilibacillus sp. S3-1-1]
MKTKDDCIFCKIVAGEIPSAKVYEDDDVLAFLDISQVTKGHTLVIPKQHVENIYETNEEIAAKVFATVPKIANALKETFQPVGINILNNNEAAAGQTVFHLHIHLIPRYDETDGFKPQWTTQEHQYDLADMASKIANNL